MSADNICFIKGANEVTLAASEVGEGKITVFIHGTGANRDRWQSVIDMLSSKFRTLKFDRRGRGDSGDSDIYSLDDEVEDLLSVLQSSDEGKPVNIVAHSYGALIALAALVEKPRLFSRIVLYEAPLAIPDLCQFVEIKQVNELEKVIENEGAEAAAVFFLKHFPRVSEADIEEMKQLPSWNERCAAANTLARELRVAHEFILEPAKLAECNIPVLLLLGGASIPAFHASARALHEMLPNSQLVELPGETHRAMDTSPQQMAKLLEEFLGKP